jgi:hypothetical protein
VVHSKFPPPNSNHEWKTDIPAHHYQERIITIMSNTGLAFFGVLLETIQLLQPALEESQNRYRGNRYVNVTSDREVQIISLTVYTTNLRNGLTSLAGNVIGTAGNSVFAPVQTVTGAGGFQSAEHQFVVMETVEGKYLLSQIYGNGDIILYEYESLDDAMRYGTAATNNAGGSVWVLYHHQCVQYTVLTIQEVMNRFHTENPEYQLMHQNCQHYSQRWYEWIRRYDRARNS